MFRQLIKGALLCGLLGVSIGVTPLAGAEQLKQDKESKVHEGLLISAGSGQVTMRAADGKEHVFKVDSMTRIMVNGKPAKLEELKAGLAIRAMVDQAGKVISISTVDDRKTGP